MGKTKLAEGVGLHKHCMECQNPIPIKNDFCSTGCKGTFEAKVKKKQIWFYIYLAAMVVVILLIAVPFLL